MGKPEEKSLWPLSMDSSDVIFESIRNKKMDDVGLILNRKAVEMQKIRDEKNKDYQNPAELKEFLRKRQKV